MDKINIVITKLVVTWLFKSSERYTLELKKEGKNFLLVKDIKGDILSGQQWSKSRYSKDAEINISELENLEIEITSYDGDDKTIYHNIKTFVIDEIKRLSLVSLMKLVNLFKGLNIKKTPKINFKNINLDFVKKLDFVRIKATIKEIAKSAIKKPAPSIQSERYHIIKYIIAKSLGDAVRVVKMKDILNGVSIPTQPERLKILLDYFVETGELSEAKEDGAYIINGKALETLDKFKYARQVNCLNLTLKIIAVLLLLSILF